MILRVIDVKGKQAVKILEPLFAAREFPCPNPNFVPRQAALIYGLERTVISEGGGKLITETLLAGGFLFTSDANAAIIGHLVTNKDADGPARNEALDILIKHLGAKADVQGFGMVCCSTDNIRLMERFTRLGFKRTDQGVSNFGRIL